MLLFHKKRRNLTIVLHMALIVNEAYTTQLVIMGGKSDSAGKSPSTFNQAHPPEITGDRYGQARKVRRGHCPLSCTITGGKRGDFYIVQ